MNHLNAAWYLTPCKRTLPCIAFDSLYLTPSHLYPHSRAHTRISSNPSYKEHQPTLEVRLALVRKERLHVVTLRQLTQPYLCFRSDI